MKEKSSTLALNMLLLPPSVQDGLRWRARWCGNLAAWPATRHPQAQDDGHPVDVALQGVLLEGSDFV